MRRLLAFDYVLDHPQLLWLPTAPEKMAAFEALSVEHRLLPRRVYRGAAGNLRRYFPLLMPVARQALVDDLPGGYVEGSKECRRAVTFVVMGHGSSAPLLEGKTWLGAVEGLDLALLVESEDNGPLRGIDVETHHVAQLFNEVRISGQLEVLDAVGL